MKHTEQSTTAKKAKPRRTEKPDPFRFGFRFGWKIGPDGSKVSVEVPLTPDDLLHPREGDQTVENSQQERDRSYLATVLRYRLADNPHALVLSDCLINWGVRGVRHHAPDVSVFEGVQEPKRNWTSFAVAKEGARPVLAIEIVSPDDYDRKVRDNDVVKKVRAYYRARVPLYAIVDEEWGGGPRRLIGYRRGTRKFAPMPLDSQGRLLLEPVRLLLGLRDERVVCWDANTGEEIGDLTEMAKARQAAEAALAAALARIRELEARPKNGRRRQ